MAPNQKLTKIVRGRVITDVQQSEAVLKVVFTDGSAMQIKLEDPASSVMVRNAAGEMEYAD